MPVHVPRHVQLVLGRDSEIPLFPYRIRFLRSGVTTAEGKEEVPMVTLEFHQVTRPTFFNLSMFEYKRGDQVVIDRTDTFLKQLRKPPWSMAVEQTP